MRYRRVKTNPGRPQQQGTEDTSRKESPEGTGANGVVKGVKGAAVRTRAENRSKPTAARDRGRSANGLSKTPARRKRARTALTEYASRAA